MAENNSIPQFVNSDSFMADKNYVKWLSDLKKRFRVAQLKAAVKVNTEMLKFYWSLGEDICEKQKQYKWGAKVIGRLSLDLRAEFPQSEGFSRTNLYDIKRWFAFYSSQIEFVHQAGGQLQKVDYANTPMPEILLFVPWRHQTVIVSKCDTINAALFYLNKVVDRLSLDMRSEFPQSEGFSRTNLYDIKRWFIFYSSQIEIVHQAGGLLQKVDNSNTPIPEILLCVPWRHQTFIVSKCATIPAALFYLNKVVEGNMSRTELEHVVKAQLYEHTGKALNNFEVTLPQPQNVLATEIIKDPYKLDFFSLPSKFSEMDLENKLATNITRFLLELGKGFAYVGRQMELDTPSGKAYFPDMVFYHTRLKCYVVVELKIVDFMPEFIGKLNFYVSAADELLRGEGDNPSIGILLCKDKDSSVVEWSLRGITTPLGVASYQLQEVYERTLLEIKQEAAEEED